MKSKPKSKVEREIRKMIKSGKRPHAPLVRFQVTTNKNKALVNHYFGEILMVPKKVAQAVAKELGKKYQTFWIYYYGTPNQRLRELFGIPDPEPKLPPDFR